MKKLRIKKNERKKELNKCRIKKIIQNYNLINV